MRRRWSFTFRVYVLRLFNKVGRWRGKFVSACAVVWAYQMKEGFVRLCKEKQRITHPRRETSCGALKDPRSRLC